MNPLLYSVMSKRFRRGFRDMFKRNSTAYAGTAVAGAVGAAPQVVTGGAIVNGNGTMTIVRRNKKVRKEFCHFAILAY